MLKNRIINYLLDFKEVHHISNVIPGATTKMAIEVAKTPNFRKRLQEHSGVPQNFNQAPDEKLRKWIKIMYANRVPTGIPRGDIIKLLREKRKNVNKKAGLQKRLRQIYKTRGIEGGTIPNGYMNLLNKIENVEKKPMVKKVSPPKEERVPKASRNVYYFGAQAGVSPPARITNNNLNISLNNLVSGKSVVKAKGLNAAARIAYRTQMANYRARVAKAQNIQNRLAAGIVDIPERVFEDSRPRKEIESIKDYQMDVARRIEELPGMLVVHSVGSGKTRTAIYAAENLLRKGIITHVIVVSPKGLIQTFKDEMSKHGLRSLGKYYYFGTEAFEKQCEKGAQLRIENALVIFDEIHELRNETQRFTTIERYARNAKKIIGLTATPIVNKLDDILSELSFVAREEMTFQSNISKYISFYERNLNNDPDYPSYMIHEVPIEEKISWMVDRIKSNPDKRFIVYTIYTDASMGTHEIKRKLDSAGIESVVITGEESDKTRSDAQREYNNGTVKVILISRAGEQGLDLKKTRGVFVVTRPAHPSTLLQVIGRAVRFRSHVGLPKVQQHVDVYLLENSKDVDQYNAKIWSQTESINKFYRSLWPGSVGIKFTKRAYNSNRQLFLNRINRGNNVVNIMHNLGYPQGVLNRTSNLSNAKKNQLRPVIRNKVLYN